MGCHSHALGVLCAQGCEISRQVIAVLLFQNHSTGLLKNTMEMKFGCILYLNKQVHLLGDIETLEIWVSGHIFLYKLIFLPQNPLSCLNDVKHLNASSFVWKLLTSQKLFQF